MARMWARALMALARRITSCSWASLMRRISSSTLHRSCCTSGQMAPKRTRARTALSQPSTRVSNPLWMAKGNQTVRLFSSRRGSWASSVVTGWAAATASAAGAASGPRR